ncbi:MAG TPA: hypothetical protein VGG39_26580 [Polyangiaceae bacterium]
MIRTALLLSFAVAVTACSSGAAHDTSAAAPATPSSPEIAKIVTRDRSITLLAGDGLVRATVFDGSGRLIGRNIPIDSLQNVDATSYEATHWSVAGKAMEPTHPVPWRK